jgi:hypothetical protein
MSRIKGKPLAKFDAEKLNRLGYVDLREYISDEMMYRMIPKSIWNYVNGLIAT